MRRSPPHGPSEAVIVAPMRSRLSERLPAGRGQRLALAALVVILAIGAFVRLWLMLAVRPALVGYADSYPYIAAADGRLFGDPLRPAGYPLFLRVGHALNENLSFTTLVQHGLGLASALLLYLAARRLGVPRWWALLPAAVVSLGGSQVMIEHAPLTEALFVFLQSGALYATARAVGQRDWAWAIAAGALAGASVTVRALGLLLVAALAACLLLGPSPRWWRRLTRPAAALCAAATLIGAYVLAHDSETGYAGLTRGGSWSLYGRAAPFADCGRFDPPEGTRVLCESTPEEERPGPNAYIFGVDISPAVQAFGTPFQASQEEHDRVGAFARAALVHQPLDWLDHALTEDLPRYVASEYRARALQGLSFDQLQEMLLTGFQGPQTLTLISQYYTTSGQFVHRGRFDAFRSYERATRVVGVLFVGLALLALTGLAFARGDLRRGGVAFTAAALVSILGPPLTLFYDARYAIPAFGPLAGAAAVGGAAVTERLRRTRSDRARAGAAPPGRAPT